MMREKLKKTLALTLACCMLCGTFPAAALAKDIDAERLPGEAAEVVRPEADVPVEETEVMTALDETPIPAQAVPARLHCEIETLTAPFGQATLFSAEETPKRYTVTATDPATGAVVSVLAYVITADTPTTHTMKLVTAQSAQGAVVVSDTLTVTSEKTGELETYTVTAVAPDAFAGQTDLTQVWLPDTVEEIGARAFKNCEQLRAVGVYDARGNADPYRLPDIGQIQEVTFWGCTRLSSVTIPKSVTDIGPSAFAYCYSLGQDYTDASGVTYGVYFEADSQLKHIDHFAFLKCIVLENITLPDGLEKISQWAFAQCAGYRREGEEIVGRTGLREIDFPDSIQEIGDNAFRECVSLERVSIPASVELVDERAFYSCSQMEELEFRGTGDRELKLGVMAFFYCRSLKTLTLPNNVKTIPEWCFGRAGEGAAIQTLVLPEGLETVGNYAFNESGIQSVTLPSSLIHIGLLAFGDCAQLEHITWGQRGEIDLLVGCMAFASCDSLRELTLPKLHTASEDNIFYDCDALEQVTLAADTNFIPASAFRDCDNLTTLRLGAGLTQIREHAFYTCPKLTAVDFTQAGALDTIGAGAFCRTALTDVTLPASLRVVGENAFGINRALTSIAVAENNVGGFYSDARGVLYQSAEGKVRLVRYPAGSAAGTFAIPAGVTHIDAYAFCHSENLTGVTFPESLEEIGQSAFSHCIRLEDISTLSTSVKWGDFIFDSCPHLTTFAFSDSITTIDAQDVAGAKNCTKLVIPASVSTLRNNLSGVTAFPVDQLPLLEELEAAPESEYFASVDGVLYNKDKTMLIAYPPAKAGEEFVVPDGVTAIAYGAFSKVQNLKRLTIPASVASAYYLSVSGALEQIDIYGEEIKLDNGYGKEGGYREFIQAPTAALTVRLQGDPTDANAVAALKSAFRAKGVQGDIALGQIQVGYFKPVTQAGDKFLEDGVVYTLLDPETQTVEVGANPHYAAAQAAIPDRVTHGGVTYTVSSVAADAFPRGVNVLTQGELTGFICGASQVVYGETLSITAPKSVGDGATVTLTGRNGSVWTTLRSGMARFPVDKALYNAVGAAGEEVEVTVSSGSVETALTLAVSPKTLTADLYTSDTLRFSKPYDRLTTYDMVTTDHLEGFPLPGDDLAFHLVGTMDSSQVNNQLYTPAMVEFVGRDARYYQLSPSLKYRCVTDHGQLYIKEVDGVLQAPTYTRVWSSEDGMRVRDSGPRGGQFVAYLPKVEDGAVVGYETVDVKGEFAYPDPNPYPDIKDLSYIGAQEGVVYRWDFVPEGNGELQEELKNYRFSGSFMPWDPSLFKGEDTLVGRTGENPPLPTYVTVSDAPDDDAPTPPPAAPTDPAFAAPPSQAPAPTPGQTEPESPAPSSAPTPTPGATQTPAPTAAPSASQAPQPTPEATGTPSAAPAASQSPAPAPEETALPSASQKPSEVPAPTPEGSQAPSSSPSASPTRTPSAGGSSSGGRPSGGGGGGGGGAASTPAAGSSPAPAEGAKPASQVFGDVVANSWYESAVRFVVDKGLFNGMAEGVFDPQRNMTRAMLVTVLARLDGQKVENTPGGAWYQGAMNWAVSHGISDGTMPENDMTREQLATMLYRYVGTPEISGGAAGFRDAEAISPYARSAMAWAVEQGILQGKEDRRLDPQGAATRAEVAVMLQRFCEQIGQR